jgi:Uma2 family endonuclease
MLTMPQLPDLPGVHNHIDRAVEVVPPYPVSDDLIIALEQHYDILLFERFADGTLLVTPPAGWRGGSRNLEMARQVANWVADGNRGLAMESSGGVRLPDGSLFAPDTTFISRERWARADQARTFAEAVPDAAFELLSQSDRVRTTMKKMRAYLANGVRLVVLIDPVRRHVYVGREGDAEPQDLGDVATLDCAPVMPGFVLDVAAVIAGGDIK